MGWLKWITGTAGESPRVRATAQDKAILDVKLQRDRMKQYQKRLRSTIAYDRARAVELVSQKQRDRALLLLRRKKHNETLLRQTDEQLATLEDLASHIEQAVIQKQVLASLERGNAVLKALNSETSIERVEQILEESAEGQAYQEEVTAMLAERLSQTDEDDVQTELDALIAEQQPLAQVQVPKKHQRVQDLPDVPNSIPQIITEAESAGIERKTAELLPA